MSSPAKPSRSLNARIGYQSADTAVLYHDHHQVAGHRKFTEFLALHDKDVIRLQELHGHVVAEIIRRSATHRKGSADKRLVTKNWPDTVAKLAFTAILITDLTDRQASELLKSRPWNLLESFFIVSIGLLHITAFPYFFLVRSRVAKPSIKLLVNPYTNSSSADAN